MAEKEYQPKIKKIDHCCMVVEDIDRSMRIYEDIYGIGPWVFGGPGEFVYVPGETYVHGKQVDFEGRLAISPPIGADGFALELIQPLDDKSHYAEYLREHGDSMHHLMVQIYDKDDWTKTTLDRGNEVTFEGYVSIPPYDQKIFCRYTDLREDLGFICETAPDPGVPWDTDYRWEAPRALTPKQYKPKFTEVVQICSVVEDLDKTVQIYEDVYGIGPWLYTGEDDFRFYKGKTFVRGRQVDFEARIACCYALNISLEIIQPLDDKSHYAEFLREDGQTMQHMMVKPTNNDQFGLMNFLRTRGNPPLFEGWVGSKPFTEQYWCNYTDARKDLGFIIELAHGPTPV